MPREDDFAGGPYDLTAPPEWERFPGLYPPLYTQTPDVFFDWVAPFLPEIELRVLLYLIRRTLGFKKQGDQITIDQIANGIITREGTRLDWGAQLGERSVQRALGGLEEKGLIERHMQVDPERGCRPSYIRLRLCDQWGQNWQARGRSSAPAPADTSLVPHQTPPSRPARRRGGVPAATSLPLAGDVPPDTDKIQPVQDTDRQETDAAIHSQERAGSHEPAFWQAVKQELSQVLAPSVYQSRVARTYQSATSGPEILVCCPDTATCQWLERQLGRSVAATVRALGGDPAAIRYIPAGS